MVVLAYHSLEDRMVKERFADWSRTEEPGYVPTGLPRAKRNPITRLLTRRPRRPSDAEVEANPRAASARLRAVERLDAVTDGRRARRGARPPALAVVHPQRRARGTARGPVARVRRRALAHRSGRRPRSRLVHRVRPRERGRVPRVARAEPARARPPQLADHRPSSARTSSGASTASLLASPQRVIQEAAAPRARAPARAADLPRRAERTRCPPTADGSSTTIADWSKTKPSLDPRQP